MPRRGTAFHALFGTTVEYPKDAKDRVMHARLTKRTAVLMASDVMPGAPLRGGNNFWVCIQCESAAEIENSFAALGKNGKVTMPLQDTFWGARFGMLIDQFGTHWMLNFDKQQQRPA